MPGYNSNQGMHLRLAALSVIFRRLLTRIAVAFSAALYKMNWLHLFCSDNINLIVLGALFHVIIVFVRFMSLSCLSLLYLLKNWQRLDIF